MFIQLLMSGGRPQDSSVPDFPPRPPTWLPTFSPADSMFALFMLFLPQDDVTFRASIFFAVVFWGQHPSSRIFLFLDSSCLSCLILDPRIPLSTPEGPSLHLLGEFVQLHFSRLGTDSPRERAQLFPMRAFAQLPFKHPGGRLWTEDRFLFFEDSRLRIFNVFPIHLSVLLPFLNTFPALPASVVFCVFCFCVFPELFFSCIYAQIVQGVFWGREI